MLFFSISRLFWNNSSYKIVPMIFFFNNTSKLYIVVEVALLKYIRPLSQIGRRFAKENYGLTFPIKKHLELLT